jgi:hypothetical protein
MYMDILRSIGGIEIYPVLSLTLFVAVFCGVLLWALRTDPARLEAMAALPLDSVTRDEASTTGRTAPASQVADGERRIP